MARAADVKYEPQVRWSRYFLCSLHVLYKSNAWVFYSPGAAADAFLHGTTTW